MINKVIEETKKLYKTLDEVNLTPEQKLIVGKLIANEKYLVLKRIEEAIEYIERHILVDDNKIIQGYLDPKEIVTLLEILRGKE